MQEFIEKPPRTTWVYALAIVLIGQAIVQGAERFSISAVVFVGIAIVLVAVALCGWMFSAPPIVERYLIAIAVAGSLLRLPMDELYNHGAVATSLKTPFIALAVVAAGLTAIILFARSRSMILGAFLLLIGIHAMMELIAFGTRLPHIDVYLIQHEGCRALVAGANPFAITFQNIYATTLHIYPPGMVVDGRVQCGYFYPPLSLLLDLPAYLAGDLRYAHLTALTLTALMLGFMQPGHRSRSLSFGAAAMVMFSPRLFFQVRMAWIEPLVLLPLCATVFFALRRWWIAAAAMLGLFLVAKQYALFVIPAIWLLLPRPLNTRHVIKLAAIAAISGGAVTLPFIFWNPHAFFHSLTALYVGMMRDDSISFLPPVARALKLGPSLAWAPLATVPASALAIWRGPRRPAVFAAAVGLILLCGFAFSTQSFGNYYFLALGALCIAVAAQTDQGEPRDQLTIASSAPPPSSAGHTNQ